jgi:hypothetical protein
MRYGSITSSHVLRHDDSKTIFLDSYFSLQLALGQHTCPVFTAFSYIGLRALTHIWHIPFCFPFSHILSHATSLAIVSCTVVIIIGRDVGWTRAPLELHRRLTVSALTCIYLRWGVMEGSEDRDVITVA